MAKRNREDGNSAFTSGNHELAITLYTEAMKYAGVHETLWEGETMAIAAANRWVKWHNVSESQWVGILSKGTFFINSQIWPPLAANFLTLWQWQKFWMTQVRNDMLLYSMVIWVVKFPKKEYNGYRSSKVLRFFRKEHFYQYAIWHPFFSSSSRWFEPNRSLKLLFIYLSIWSSWNFVGRRDKAPSEIYHPIASSTLGWVI